MPKPSGFTILYDGDCPFCRREMAFLAALDKQGKLAFEDISSVAADHYGRSPAELMRFIHGVTKEGDVVTGMEVFRRAYREVGLGWLLAPTGWPGLKQMFDVLYRLFARYRVRLGRCFGRGCSIK